jgi:hypothetical protein
MTEFMDAILAIKNVSHVTPMTAYKIIELAQKHHTMGSFKQLVHTPFHTGNSTGVDEKNIFPFLYHHYSDIITPNLRVVLRKIATVMHTKKG